jgi:CrcB protein
MTGFLIVAAGGAIGAALRYGIASLLPATSWPWPTLVANVTGGLLVGVFSGWLAQRGGADNEQIRLFAAVGLLGGFTTFSAFSLETVQMIERGRYGLAGAYCGISVLASIGALFIGLFVARRLLGQGL